MSILTVTKRKKRGSRKKNSTPKKSVAHGSASKARKRKPEKNDTFTDEADFLEHLKSFLLVLASVVFFVSRSFGLSKEDREDLAQETFYRAWSCPIRVPKARGQYTWVYKVAKRLAITLSQKNGRQVTADFLHDFGDCEGDDDAIQDAILNHEARAGMAEIHALVRRLDVKLALEHAAQESSVGVRVAELHDMKGYEIGKKDWPIKPSRTQAYKRRKEAFDRIRKELPVLGEYLT
ncbi:MAG: sigma-70 family RNA polymerase sigma factor [Candidatus Hydrogenedentes bacterium]|nr:sigma-70 family RNA polymerase sigma factor [Candidatus Hydrogenedentota bacterium]